MFLIEYHRPTLCRRERHCDAIHVFLPLDVRGPLLVTTIAIGNTPLYLLAEQPAAEVAPLHSHAKDHVLVACLKQRGPARLAR